MYFSNRVFNTYRMEIQKNFIKQKFHSLSFLLNFVFQLQSCQCFDEKYNKFMNSILLLQRTSKQFPY